MKRLCQVESSSTSKSDPIPLDLLETKLLVRLPAKSLMKFRCVSKTWSSIIRSRRFVDSYYAAASKTRRRFTVAFSNGVFVKDDATRYLFVSSSSHEEDEKSSSSLVATLDMKIPSVGLVIGSKCPSVHGFLSCSLLIL